MQLQTFICRSSYAIALGAEPPVQSLPFVDKRPQSATADTLAPSQSLRVAPAQSSSSPIVREKSAGPTAGQAAMQQARAGKSFVNDLVQMRTKGDRSSLEKFAAAMSGKLGMPIEDARVLVDAMSRGGTDALALGAAMTTLNAMSPDDRSVWMNHLMPACSKAARAVAVIDDDPTLKTLGAGTDQARAIADFTYVSSLMANRNRAATTKPTAEQEASLARDAAYNRVASSHGAGAIRAQAMAIDAKDGVDESLRNKFAASLAKRLGQSIDSAYALIDAMRKKSQVSGLIADGLDKLEHLPEQTALSYAGAFVRTAVAATKAEAAIAANPFESRAGATSDAEVQSIGDLADLNAVFKQLAATATGAA